MPNIVVWKKGQSVTAPLLHESALMNHRNFCWTVGTEALFALFDSSLNIKQVHVLNKVTSLPLSS